MTSIDPKEV